MASESRDHRSSTQLFSILQPDHETTISTADRLTCTNPKHDHYRHSHAHEPEQLRNRHRKDVDEMDQNISIPASIKQAEMTIAPFLTEHIPSQYNPIGGGDGKEVQPILVDHDHDHEHNHIRDQSTNTKFCYRHRPDLKCRRQVNEPSMDQLQNELASLSQSDQQAISHVWSLFSASPGKHRNLMLQGILSQCCFPQLSYISANVRDLIKIDFLAALPNELGFKILCYLDTTSLCKAAQVSQKWRTLADDDVVWHKMCEQHIDRKCTKCGWGLPLLERKRLRMEKRQIQLRATGRGINEWSPEIAPTTDGLLQLPGSVPSTTGTKRVLEESDGAESSAKKRCTKPIANSVPSDEDQEPRTRPWKDVYKDRFKVGSAWKHGRCTTKIFRGHTNGVTCLQFDENILITGSYDATIKVWDIATGKELRTLHGHRSGIRCLQFDDNKLMTGSLDNSLKLWDWKKGECLRTFPAHNAGIISLHFVGRYVASGSQDKTIRVYDSEKRETFLLKGHKDWVNSVKIDEPSRTLFSASDDLTVRLWDLDTKQCIKIFKGHVGQVQQVMPMPVEFELDEHRPDANEKDDDASSVSSVTVTCDGRHAHHLSSGSDFWLDDPNRPAPPKYMLTGSLDSTIRLWNTHFTPGPSMAHRPSTSSVASFGSNSSSASDTPAFEVLATDPQTNSHVPRAQACVRTFFGHVEGIWALSADHLRLISGSEDRMMKVWDPRTGKCERTFTGHQGPVTCAWLSDSRVASGSEDCDVRMLCFGE